MASISNSKSSIELNILELKKSHIPGLIQDFIFRSNSDLNTKFDMNNVSETLLRQKARLPIFLLNAINYERLRELLSTTALLSSTTHLDALYQLAKEQLNKSKDELTYWLIEVEPHQLMPVLEYIQNELKIDLAMIDTKLSLVQSHFLRFSELGIQTNDDLVKAMLLIKESFQK